MKRFGRIWSIVALAPLPSAALAQSRGLQNFELRQLQLDRTLAMLGMRSASKKRGPLAIPSEVEGKIQQQRRNSDGSITATTTHGRSVTYDPQVFRPIYVQQRDRTLFGLIPDRTVSVGEFWTGAPGDSGFRTSVTYTDLPNGKLPTPDAKASTTACLSQSASWIQKGGAADTYGLNVSRQFNSDTDPLQYSGSLGLTEDQGATRQVAGCATATRSLASWVSLSASGSYYNGGSGSNGWGAQANLSFTVTPKLVIYFDGAPPSGIQGVAPWDIGLQATVCTNLSLSFEFDQGQTWFLGLTGRFAAR